MDSHVCSRQQEHIERSTIRAFSCLFNLEQHVRYYSHVGNIVSATSWLSRQIVEFNPYPADQNFRLLRLPPNSTKVLFHTFIHTLPTVTKLYATISSCTACQTYQKLHKIYYIFFTFFLHNFQSKIVNLSVNKI